MRNRHRRLRVLPTTYRATDRDVARLSHTDIADLDDASLWAEQRTLEHALAQRLFRRQRPRIFTADRFGDPIVDRVWLLERIARLRAERSRRRQRCVRG